MFPDISEYQGAVDWSALGAAYRAGQIEAISIRAGFGTVRADHQFGANQAGARTQGIPTVYYWFNYPTFNTPQAEAAMFNATVGSLLPGEAMCGDFEDDPTSGAFFPRGQAGVDWGKAFLMALRSPQNATWFYTYTALFETVGMGPLLATWPFWWADYTGRTDDPFGAIAHQFTSRGSTPGVTGPCDQSTVLKEPLSQWLTGGGLPMDQALFNTLMEGWLAGHLAQGTTSAAEMVGAILPAVQQVYNLVGGADAHVQAVKAELDTVEAQVAAAQPVNLTALKTAVDALSKHLGVGTA